MKRDKRQRPADTDPRAGTSEAERQENFTQLTGRRSKLSADEAALLRQMFPAIRAAHHKLVWNRLQRARLSRHDAGELYQDVFIGLGEVDLTITMLEAPIPAEIREQLGRLPSP